MRSYIPRNNLGFISIFQVHRNKTCLTLFNHLTQQVFRVAF